MYEVHYLPQSDLNLTFAEYSQDLAAHTVPIHLKGLRKALLF